jgi:hypothetical protein
VQPLNTEVSPLRRKERASGREDKLEEGKERASGREDGGRVIREQTCGLKPVLEKPMRPEDESSGTWISEAISDGVPEGLCT